MRGDAAAGEVFAKLDGTRPWRKQAGNPAEERRLSGTVTANDAKVIFNIHIVVQVADHFLVPVSKRQLAASYQRNNFIHNVYFKAFFNISRFDCIMER